MQRLLNGDLHFGGEDSTVILHTERGIQHSPAGNRIVLIQYCYRKYSHDGDGKDSFSESPS